MINIIFKTRTSFNSAPNELVPINEDYSLNNYCAFGDLSKSNIFIGENNSGKSRFLRSLFVDSFHSLDSQNINTIFEDHIQQLRTKKTFSGNGSLAKFAFIYNEVKSNNITRYSSTYDFIYRVSKMIVTPTAQRKHYFPTVRGIKDYKTIIHKKLDNFSKSSPSAKEIQSTDSIKYYISLLDLEKAGLESFDIYREITNHEYFKNSKLNIITGGDLYGKIKSMLLDNEEQRRIISEFQDFLYEHFFFEYGTVQLIPYEKEKVLYVKIGEDERPIYDWGDGTQQLIIILFSLFIHKDESDNLFFIEEPEMYLHPGMLRKFIEVINSDVFPNHQYYITTHSNAVLDVSADANINMSIFKFTKNKSYEDDTSRFTIEQCNSGDVSLLNVLGVRNSSVFLSNCSIWVEGVTDRLYLKHYLKLYFEKHGMSNSFRENIDYTFIEYGGGNIVHFNFEDEDYKDSINAKYINNRIFLIADNDNTKEGQKKHERKERLKQVLKENFYELPVIEIENLLSTETIKQILLHQNPNHKNVIEEKFKKRIKFKNVKVGEHIDDLFEGVGLKKYSEKSGTVRDKLGFCQTAIGLLNDYNMLTEEAKELVEKIVNFIKENN